MKKKLKISFVANTSWSIYNFRLEVAQELKKQGNSIYVIAPRDKHSEKLIAEGFVFIEAPIKSYSNNPLDDWKYFSFLLKTYRHLKFDHVFHYTIKANVYGSFAAKISGVNSTAVVTGLGRLLNMKKGWKRSIVHFLYKSAIVSTNHLWFLNEDDREHFYQKGIIKSRDHFILPSEGVNLKKYKKRERKDFAIVSFLFAGRLLKEKGIELFIKAASRVKKHHPYVCFDIVGFIDTKDRDSIDQNDLIHYQSIGTIQYHGDTEDIRPYISETSCVVLPSKYGEGISRILLEAAAMSTPIITSKNRGCEDIVIDGFNGFLCEQGDIAGLAEQMMAFISLDSEAKEIMGNNGRTIVSDKYGIDYIVRCYNDHLKKNSIVSSHLYVNH